MQNDTGRIVTKAGTGGNGVAASGKVDAKTPVDTLPILDPVAAKPSNDPGNWVGTRDYRSSWINRGWTGVARFTVTVGINGRVRDCRLVSSTGHDALDMATCKLVQQRARFTPARDSAGEKTTGSYTTAIRWELPD